MAAITRVAVLPPPGVVRGATPSVSAGRWYDANLMRWRSGQAIPIGGEAAVIMASLFDGPGRDVLTWHDNSGTRWAAVGTDNNLYAYNFVTTDVYQITPEGVGPLAAPGGLVGYGLGDYGSDAYGTARDPADIGPYDISAVLGDAWSMDLFGETLMVVPTQDGRLFQWLPSTPATAAAQVANAPINNLGVFTTDERSVVLIGAGGDPRNVAWSDQENPELWAPDVTNLAGSKELVTEGRPLCGKRVPGGNLIFTDNDVHIMTYVGTPYAYGINRIGYNCGPISQRAVCQAGGIVTWMGTQSFWQYAGAVEPLPCDVGDWLFSLLNRDMIGRIFASPNPAFTEHWWFWPDEGAVECDRYVAVNYAARGNPWTIGLSQHTASDMSGAMIRPVYAGPDNQLYLGEYGILDNGASRVGTVYLESGDLILGGGEGDNRFHVVQVAYDYAGDPGALGFRFFPWEESGGAIGDTGTFPIVTSNGRTDARFSCRGCRVRVEGLDDTSWALGKTRLLARLGGRR